MDFARGFFRLKMDDPSMDQSMISRAARQGRRPGRSEVPGAWVAAGHVMWRPRPLWAWMNRRRRVVAAP